MKESQRTRDQKRERKVMMMWRCTQFTLMFSLEGVRLNTTSDEILRVDKMTPSILENNFRVYFLILSRYHITQWKTERWGCQRS